MRVLLPLLLLVMLVGLVGFMVTNASERVIVTVWGTEYSDVPLFLVVLVALTLGIAFTSVIALVEGATIRLSNHRLRRELRKLETEINYLRTQPPAIPLAEPDALEEEDSLEDLHPEGPPGAGTLPSAPVYVSEDDELASDAEDDDVYTGGRAV